MEKKRPHVAKIASPRLIRAVKRERLFAILDEIADYPVTWISSPAGAGKTTLVASYLEERGIPALWYSVDESDSDIASFFYYFAEGAKMLGDGAKESLPQFSPELRPSLSTFTQRYFDAFFSKINAPLAIIFDNYQDAPKGSAIHNAMRIALRRLPESVRIFIVSREGFPPQFSVLEAESVVASVGWEEIRFTIGEVREIVRLREKSALEEETLQSLHRESQGWISAIIMMLADKQIAAIEPGSVGRSSVFSYFAMEVFRKFDARLREFLLKAAPLNNMSAEMAGELTGVRESNDFLTYLHRNHYFTDRYGGVYRFHPLFREFLLDRARKTYDDRQFAALCATGGRLLAKSGRIDEAVRLFLDTGAYGEALALAVEHARALLRTGRYATLKEWAGSMPADVANNAPWLFYWLGIGCLATDPPEARRYLEKAFALFQTNADVVGTLLSVSGIMNSIILEWNDYHPLDRWIEWIDENIDPETPLPSAEVEVNVTAAMVCALTWRRPSHPRIATWVERALAASEKVEDAELRLMARSTVIECHTQLGNIMEMFSVAEEFRRLRISPEAPPLVQLAFIVRAAEFHDWMKGSWDETMGFINKAIDLATELGSDFYLCTIYAHATDRRSRNERSRPCEGAHWSNRYAQLCEQTGHGIPRRYSSGLLPFGAKRAGRSLSHSRAGAASDCRKRRLRSRGLRPRLLCLRPSQSKEGPGCLDAARPGRKGALRSRGDAWPLRFASRQGEPLVQPGRDDRGQERSCRGFQHGAQEAVRSDPLYVVAA